MSTPATASVRSWYNFRAAASGTGITEVLIYDEIGAFGISAKDFAADLARVPEDHEIHFHINSPGGEVMDGIAIFNAIQRDPHLTVAIIDGIAASMASVIAMAADEVRMPANAYLFVHNPWTRAMGDADDMRKTAEDLDKLEATLVAMYATRDITPARARELMRADSLLTAAEALTEGLCDVVLDPVSAKAAVLHFSHPKLTAHFAAMTASQNQDLPADPAATPAEPPVEPVTEPATEPAGEPAAPPVEETPAPAEQPSAPAEAPAPATAPEAKSLLSAFAAWLKGPQKTQAAADDIRAKFDAAQARITSLETDLAAARAEVADLQKASTTLQAVMASCGVDPDLLPRASADIIEPTDSHKPGQTIEIKTS